MEHLSSVVVRVPRGGDKVYKDQCVYCFQGPVSFPNCCCHCQFCLSALTTLHVFNIYTEKSLKQVKVLL